MYEPWNLVNHITDFGIKLKHDQGHLLLSKIKISNKEMTQFYVEQMFDSRMFEKLELKEWEKKDGADKTFEDAIDYFEEIIDHNETYEANAGGTAKRSGFDSTMHI